MTNVKILYAARTRTAKEKLARAAENAAPSDGYKEEQMLIARFRKRAREDFKTLRPASSAPKG